MDLIPPHSGLCPAAQLFTFAHFFPPPFGYLGNCVIVHAIHAITDRFPLVFRLCPPIPAYLPSFVVSGA